MKIRSAEFVVSNSDVRKCPDVRKPEYAFIGRSNVGKSSLINMLVERKGLAKTSSMPGKTLLINHFLINNDWYLVDLPGYGFAQRGKESREDYVLEREQMTCLFVLVDGRHKPQKIDMEFMEWLGECEVPFAIVFTKMDKMGKIAGAQNVEAYKQEMLQTWEELPPVFVTSSETRLGREELLTYIGELNEQMKAQ